MSCYRKGLYMFHSSTRGLPLYTFQIPILQKQNAAEVNKCLILCDEQCTLTKETGEWTKRPALQKRDCLEKSPKSDLWAHSKKTKSTRTIGSVPAEKIELVSENRVELEHGAIVDYFSEENSTYDSGLVYFREKTILN